MRYMELYFVTCMHTHTYAQTQTARLQLAIDRYFHLLTFLVYIIFYG